MTSASAEVAAAAGKDVAVAGLRCHVDEAGSGPPLLVLHRSTGPAWTPFLDQLARRHRVLALHLSGYGRSERLTSARSPRDLGILALQTLDVLGENGLAAVGLGFGGWVLAEMATMQASRFSSMVLVGAAGIKPTEGFIHDPMMESYEAYVREGFADPATFDSVFGESPSPELTELWDFSREMTARVTWKQWMWSGTLPALLAGVQTPSLVVWGSEDRIVPLDCGQQYARILPAATLKVIDGGGHNLDLERPEELAALVVEFAMRRGA